MAELSHTRKCPLGGVKHGSREVVALRENSFVRSFDLRVKPGTPDFSSVTEALGVRLPLIVGQTQQGTVSNGTQINALCLGPDWWLIVGETDVVRLLEPLRAEFHFSMVDVSGQRTQIEIEGPMARGLLEHLWEQDLREARFVKGSCTQGLMAKAPVVLWHPDQNRYCIFVRSSFARHLWATLVDASVEIHNPLRRWKDEFS